MDSLRRFAGLWMSIVLFGAVGAAQESARPPTVEIPAERLDRALGDPLSARALVTKPLPITAVVSWSLETRRHRGLIWCHALSPDGRVLATGGLDGTIRCWDVESGKLLRALIGHDSYVAGLDWSPDGNTLASAGTWDTTVRLWDTRSGRPLRILKGHPAEVSRVKWSPDGRTVVAAGGQSGAFSCWNALTSMKKSTLEVGQTILDMAWHPDGKSVAIAGQSMPVQLWDPEKNKVMRSVGNPKDSHLGVAWSPDGKTLAAGTQKEAILFDSAGKMLQTLPSPANAVTWLQAGKQVATLLPDSIKVWDASTGNMQTTIPVGGAAAFAVTPDNAAFVVTSSTAIAVHDSATGKSLRRFDSLAGTAPPYWWSGKTLVTGVGSSKLTLWDAETGKSLRTLEGHIGGIEALAFAPSGKTLATASLDKTVRLWDSATGKPIHTLTEHTDPVQAVAFTSDGKLLASGGADKQVLVWDPATGKLLHTLTGSKNVTALAWKPAATALLANSREEAVQSWNIKTGKVEKTFEGTHEIVSLAWSPEGTRVAAGQDNGTVHIWQASSAKIVHALEHAGSPPQVSSLAWSPNGFMLAAGRGNHTMQLWEPKGGKEFHHVPTMAPVARVGWSPGSSTVAVTSHDRTLRFIDAASGKVRAVVLAEDDQMMAVSFDGHYRAPAAEAELVYVVQTNNSQHTYTPSQFAVKFALKNSPAKVSLVGK